LVLAHRFADHLQGEEYKFRQREDSPLFPGENLDEFYRLHRIGELPVDVLQQNASEDLYYVLRDKYEFAWEKHEASLPQPTITVEYVVKS